MNRCLEHADRKSPSPRGTSPGKVRDKQTARMEIHPADSLTRDH